MGLEAASEGYNDIVRAIATICTDEVAAELLKREGVTL